MPDGTLNGLPSPFADHHIEAITHGRPSPRNTLTELLPVMLPTAESACFDVLAAVTEARVSGRDVPRATMVMAVTDCSRPRAHPKRVATSATMAVIVPIMASAMMKAAHPLQVFLGGIQAKASFQKIHKKWNKP